MQYVPLVVKVQHRYRVQLTRPAARRDRIFTDLVLLLSGHCRCGVLRLLGNHVLVWSEDKWAFTIAVVSFILARFYYPVPTEILKVDCKWVTTATNLSICFVAHSQAGSTRSALTAVWNCELKERPLQGRWRKKTGTFNRITNYNSKQR